MLFECPYFDSNGFVVALNLELRRSGGDGPAARVEAFQAFWVGSAVVDPLVARVRTTAHTIEAE